MVFERNALSELHERSVAAKENVNTTRSCAEGTPGTYSWNPSHVEVLSNAFPSLHAKQGRFELSFSKHVRANVFLMSSEARTLS